ncbi:AzlC family ABC transporter permease [Tissierella creatinini]|nr:AzlC family ABC transporter permease [Tissierella creatinini]TJX62378.1 AzlC family ABC transporter permease [Soehngenia saccharolytica]
MRDGFPIGLGYFAVAFSLGIAAKNAGLTPFQGFLTSILINASAGQYAGFMLMAANASYLELIIVTLIANARYFLMSSALSQHIKPDMPLYHRFLLGYEVTDEIFGITIARPGDLNPYYTYGAFFVASPCWATGTALGIIAGNLLPLRIVSALSVALYGMFLAVIIPPVHNNKVIGALILISFAASFAFSWLPVISTLSSGTRTIILTVAISALVSILFPKELRRETQNES